MGGKALSLRKIASRVLHRLRRLAPVGWVYEHQELLILQLERENFAASVATDDVNLNDRDSLKQFVATESWHNPGALLEEFNARIERGEVVASIVREGVLAAYLWLNPGQGSAYLPLVRQHYAFPAGSSTLYNGYTHPLYRGSGHFQRLIRRLVAWWFEQNPQGSIHVAVEPGNTASLHALEKVGFSRVTRLCFTRSLGRIKMDRKDIEQHAA